MTRAALPVFVDNTFCDCEHLIRAGLWQGLQNRKILHPAVLEEQLCMYHQELVLIGCLIENHPRKSLEQKDIRHLETRTLRSWLCKARIEQGGVYMLSNGRTYGVMLGAKQDKVRRRRCHITAAKAPRRPCTGPWNPTSAM